MRDLVLTTKLSEWGMGRAGVGELKPPVVTPLLVLIVCLMNEPERKHFVNAFPTIERDKFKCLFCYINMLKILLIFKSIFKL